MNFYSRAPMNYEADCLTAQRLADENKTIVTLHAHPHFTGSLPHVSAVACNEHCRAFKPTPKEAP